LAAKHRVGHAVVGADPADRDDLTAPAPPGVRQDELELANLVPAVKGGGEIVALDPQRLEPEPLSQRKAVLHGRVEGRQAEPGDSAVKFRVPDEKERFLG
jgi:hypothetical protein